MSDQPPGPTGQASKSGPPTPNAMDGTASTKTTDSQWEKPPDAVGINSPLGFLHPAEAPGELGRLGGYRILGTLGRGGMGMVLLAEDPGLKRKLAVKVMLPEVITAGSKERFFREARATAALHHDNVVPIFQVGEDNGVPFLAMPFLQGEPLDKFIDKNGKLPVKEALRIILEALAGLSAAHSRDMVHRDLKPANLWLGGPRKRVIVLDFGLAQSKAEDSKLTRVGALMGTPAYMAPEQAHGKPVDRRADLFSLGVVLYEMLTGERPFKGNTTMAILSSLISTLPMPPAEIDPEIPREVSDICMRMLEKAVEKRPTSARKIAALIQSFGKNPSAKTMAQPDAPKTLTPPQPAITLPQPPSNPVAEPIRELPRKKKKQPKLSVAPWLTLPGTLVVILFMGVIIYNQWRKMDLLNQSTSPSQAGLKQPTKEPEKEIAAKDDPIPKSTENKAGTSPPPLPDGFQNLFPEDGVPKGWIIKRENTILENLQMGASWEVKNGILQAEGKSSCLVSEKEYHNFILEFEIKLADMGDSGVALRAPLFGDPAIQGMEFQIVGDGVDKKFLNGTFRNGGIVMGVPPAKNVTLSRDWNQIRVELQGSHLRCDINGEKIHDKDLSTFDKPLLLKGVPYPSLKDRPRQGRLGFDYQSWDESPIYFRKVRLKELPPEDKKSSSEEKANPQKDKKKGKEN